MKTFKIRAKTVPTTSINVEGKNHYYFETESLGKVRAVFIASQQTKEQKLENLMDCSERLHERFIQAFDALRTIPHSEPKSRKAALLRIKNIQKANRRVNRKISLLMDGE